MSEKRQKQAEARKAKRRRLGPEAGGDDEPLSDGSD